MGGDSGGLGSTLGLGLGSTFNSTFGSTLSGGGGGSRLGAGNSVPPSGGPRDAAHAGIRSSRHQHHDDTQNQNQHHPAAGSGILSEFALSALSGNGGSSELSVAVGGRGGGAAGGGGGGGPAAGGRAATASASAQQALQYVGGPLPLSPATRGAAPPGSVLSSFASAGSASLRWGPICFSTAQVVLLTYFSTT